MPMSMSMFVFVFVFACGVAAAIAIALFLFVLRARRRGLTPRGTPTHHNTPIIRGSSCDDARTDCDDAHAACYMVDYAILAESKHAMDGGAELLRARYPSHEVLARVVALDLPPDPRMAYVAVRELHDAIIGALLE